MNNLNRKDELHAWKLASSYTGHEAACLIVGVHPGDETQHYKAVPVLAALKDSYDGRCSWSISDCAGDCTSSSPPPGTILSVAMTRHVEEDTLCDWLQDAERTSFRNQKFSPAELDAWVAAAGVTSHFWFEADGAPMDEASGPRRTAAAETRRCAPPAWPDNEYMRAFLWAFDKHYTGVDPDDPNTWPKNVVVSEDLQEQFGISKNMADVMASMMRPETGRPGRRRRKTG